MDDYLRGQGIQKGTADYAALMRAGSTLAGLAVGAVVSGGDVHDMAMAGNIALTATSENYLKHPEAKAKDDLIKKRQECANDDCRQAIQVAIDAIDFVDKQRDQAYIDACQVKGPACDQATRDRDAAFATYPAGTTIGGSEVGGQYFKLWLAQADKNRTDTHTIEVPSTGGFPDSASPMHSIARPEGIAGAEICGSSPNGWCMTTNVSDGKGNYYMRPATTAEAGQIKNVISDANQQMMFDGAGFYIGGLVDGAFMGVGKMNALIKDAQAAKSATLAAEAEARAANGSAATAKDRIGSVLEMDRVAANLPTVDALSQAATTANRNGLTDAGRALQKHSDRPGSAYSASDKKTPTLNNEAQAIVDDILSNPGTTVQARVVIENRQRITVIEAQAPDGRTLRFNKDGTRLIGFREP